MEFVGQNRRCRILSFLTVLADLLHPFAQALSGLIPIESARGDIENKRFPLIGGQSRARQQIVAFQENQTGSERSAFVFVDKGVISAKIKQVSSGDIYR